MMPGAFANWNDESNGNAHRDRMSIEKCIYGFVSIVATVAMIRKKR